MSNVILTLSDADFENDVLKADLPMLVDFWAEWCGPCRSLAPVIDTVAASYQHRLQVAKLNVDDNPSTPGKYAVRALPTLLLFKNGDVVEQLVGLVTKEVLETAIEKHLNTA